MFLLNLDGWDQAVGPRLPVPNEARCAGCVNRGTVSLEPPTVMAGNLS